MLFVLGVRVLQAQPSAPAGERELAGLWGSEVVFPTISGTLTVVHRRSGWLVIPAWRTAARG